MKCTVIQSPQYPNGLVSDSISLKIIGELRVMAKVLDLSRKLCYSGSIFTIVMSSVLCDTSVTKATGKNGIIEFVCRTEKVAYYIQILSFLSQ